MLKNPLIVAIALFGFLTAGYCQDRNLKADAKMHYDLGNIFYQQGRFEEAQQEFQKAMDILKTSEASAGADKGAAAKVKTPVKTTEPAPLIKETAKPKAAVSEYAIGEDDVLKISVWQNPDLEQEAIVRPDGMISFPLIGDITAKGLSITGLTQEITTRLSEFVKSPQVSISLKKMGGSKIIVLGEVMRPGVVSVTGAKTLLEAIGQAGGFSKDAVSSSVVLIRGGFAQPQPQRINLSKALEGREVLKQNVALQSEDIIFVPKKFIADLNYFLSQVLDPISKGAYTSTQLKTY
jgi:polysaccharide export outer membrane protein